MKTNVFAIVSDNALSTFFAQLEIQSVSPRPVPVQYVFLLTQIIIKI